MLLFHHTSWPFSTIRNMCFGCSLFYAKNMCCMRYTVFALRHQSDSRKMNQNIESGDMSSQERKTASLMGRVPSFVWMLEPN